MTFTDCFASLLNNYFPLIYQHFSFLLLRFVKLFSNYLKFQLKREKQYSIQGIYVTLLFEQFKCQPEHLRSCYDVLFTWHCRLRSTRFAVSNKKGSKHNGHKYEPPQLQAAIFGNFKQIRHHNGQITNSKTLNNLT